MILVEEKSTIFHGLEDERDQIEQQKLIEHFR